MIFLTYQYRITDLQLINLPCPLYEQRPKKWKTQTGTNASTKEDKTGSLFYYDKDKSQCRNFGPRLRLPLFAQRSSLRFSLPLNFVCSCFDKCPVAAQLDCLRQYGSVSTSADWPKHSSAKASAYKKRTCLRCGRKLKSGLCAKTTIRLSGTP